MTGQTLLGTRFFANFVFLDLFASDIFVQRDPIFIKLMAQPLHIFHDVMKLSIILHSLGRAPFQLIDKERM